MAKSSAADLIMPPAKLKPLLVKSKQEPVQAALAISADGEGIVLLDKKAKPKQVLAMLKASAAKGKLALQTNTLRFGHAEVDLDYAPGIVRFRINKEPPGQYRTKMIEVVRPLAFQNVEFLVDPALEEEEEAGQATDQAQPSGPVRDVGQLMAKLHGLVERIPGTAGDDAARKAAFAKLAGAADQELKAGDLEEAAEVIAQLQAALDTPAEARASTAAAAKGSAAGAVAYGKARLIWLSTRKKITSEVDALAGQIRADYADEGLADAIVAQFRGRVAPILDTLDEGLADTLDGAVNQTDPQKRSELVAEARTIIGRYQTYLAGEPLIALIDENPYATIALQRLLSTTLTALSAAIR